MTKYGTEYDAPDLAHPNDRQEDREDLAHTKEAKKKVKGDTPFDKYMENMAKQ